MLISFSKRLTSAWTILKCESPFTFSSLSKRPLPLNCCSFTSSVRQMDKFSNQRPQHIYHWLDDVENLDNYIAGGYHPTHIGDEFLQGRYRVIHKLGFGGYSTGMYPVIYLPPLLAQYLISFQCGLQETDEKIVMLP